MSNENPFENGVEYDVKDVYESLVDSSVDPFNNGVEYDLKKVLQAVGGGGGKGAVKFIGVTTTELADGSTTAEITVNGKTVTAEVGNIALYDDKEFIFNGTAWQEFGSASLDLPLAPGTGTNSLLVSDIEHNVASENYSYAEGYGTTASGKQSHAEGFQTTASGAYSHAEGYGSQYTSNNVTYISGAKGKTDHTEGYQNIADSGTSSSSYAAHAEGLRTQAIASAAHAEGCSTTASGMMSHAEGNNTIASGDLSHAEGGNTKSSGTNSHAEGDSTTASGQSSHAEGHATSTTAGGMYAHAEGDSTVASGQSSHAEGSSVTASGNSSHAEGIGGQYTSNNATYISGAKGKADHAEGYQTIANSGSGDYDYAAHAEGYRTQATAHAAHAEGTSTTASGYQSHAEGAGTKASGDQAHAEGAGTKATFAAAHAEGGGATASGAAAHAEGGGTTASGAQAHAEGGGAKASGDSSHAEGGNTTASGMSSHAEGGTTTASGDNSHAEGAWSKALAIAAHAEGYITTASGENSHAEGKETIATRRSQHVFGEYNIAETGIGATRGTYVEIVGKGTSSSARSNARTLDWSGNEVLAGNLTASGGSITVGQTTFTENQLSSINNIEKISDVVGNLFNDSEAISSATGITRVGASEYVGTASAFETFVLNNYTLDPSADNYVIAFDVYTEANSSSSGTGLEVQYGNRSSMSTLASFDNDQTDSYHFENFFSVIYPPTETDRTLGLSFKANDAPDNIWHISNIRLVEGMEVPDGITAKDAVARDGVSELKSEITQNGSYIIAPGTGTFSAILNVSSGSNANAASGDYSYAEGFHTSATGTNSHAEGDRSTASGESSHAEGTSTTASGRISHAEGLGTIANHVAQRASGAYNVADQSTAAATAKGNYIEIVGNGTSNSNRSNARTLDWSGNEVLAGNLTAGGGSVTIGQTTITEAQLQSLLALLQQ